MKELAIKEKSKDFFRKVIFDFKYGRKFRKLHIDNSFSEALIERNGEQEKDVLEIIRRSKTKRSFEKNIRDYLKTNNANIYGSILLLGNITGKYVFNTAYYQSSGLNIDAFTSKNQELFTYLKSHFFEYIINNNSRKNTFANRIKKERFEIRDLSQDINEDNVIETFEKVLNGEEIDDMYVKPYVIIDYLMKTIGTYSREDIKDNFDFILYDINSGDTSSIEDRRKKYALYSKLTNDERKK